MGESGVIKARKQGKVFTIIAQEVRRLAERYSETK